MKFCFLTAANYFKLWLKDRDRDRKDTDRDVTNISDTFKTEKKIRDEEEEMNRYIETELLKRRGIERKFLIKIF